MKHIILVVALFAALAAAQNMTAGCTTDKDCSAFGANACCATTKVTLLDKLTEMKACGLPSTFDSLTSAAKATGQKDFSISCTNAVFIKMSAAVLVLLAFLF